MILAHLSDLHLGFQAFDRESGGTNVRELDVASAFHRAVEQVVELRPDVVVISGDIFDRPEPSHRALVVFSRGLELLQDGLAGVPVLVVAGARDTPQREGDPGALAAFEPFADVWVATEQVQRLSVGSGRISALLVPYRALLEAPPPPMVRSEDAEFEILIAYATPGDGVALSEHEWDYVGLGSHHQMHQWAPRVFHAGSLERVGPAPWDEAAVEKGFLTVNLEDGTHVFHPIQGRAVVALAPLDLDPERRERLPERVHEVLAEVPGGIEGKVVRLTLRGLDPRDLPLIEGLFPEYRMRALHLEVEITDRPSASPTVPVLTQERLIEGVSRRMADSEDGTISVIEDVVSQARRRM